MKKFERYGFVLSLVTCIMIFAAAVASFVVFFEKKKKVEDLELDDYLDKAIL